VDATDLTNNTEGKYDRLLVSEKYDRLWEWMDGADKVSVVAAIASGTSCSDRDASGSSDEKIP
jgi:hypothetical protein